MCQQRHVNLKANNLIKLGLIQVNGLIFLKLEKTKWFDVVNHYNSEHYSALCLATVRASIRLPHYAFPAAVLALSSLL